MNYVAEGLYLSKRRYELRDEKSNEQKDITCTDVLVYDEIDKDGYSQPRVVRVTVPTEEDDGIVHDPLERVRVEFSLSLDRKTGNLKPKPLAVLPFINVDEVDPF